MRVSFIVPALDEADGIAPTLKALQPARRRGHEVIVVDGGSRDGTPRIATPLSDAVLAGPRGRAVQMNAGAERAGGEILAFVHADTLVPSQADRLIGEAVAAGHRWGRFDVRLSGHQPLLRVVERLMSLRSRLTGIATGDQVMFVETALFESVGGFPAQPLMEDVALSRTLRQRERPACLGHPVITSSRRWERDGLLRTIITMWWLRTRYALGAPAERLARAYYR
jgi:rSAM/selenodomain-associated transferase 2